ncbi:MAG: dihydrofolate reductase [Nitrospiraceae bacterium]|nr:dihydrofolate reductase [Nitrospiraceae bacterium]
MLSPPRPRIALIAAVSRNGIIGKNGTLPWHLPADLKYLKARTTGKRIVMGRRTWESFPKPLPDREHVVVSSKALNVPTGVWCVRTLAEALALANPTDPVFVIGGNALYAEALSLIDDLYLTEIDADVEGDTYFPNWPRNAFHEISRESHSAPLAPGGEDVRFDFVHYVRK